MNILKLMLELKNYNQLSTGKNIKNLNVIPKASKSCATQDAHHFFKAVVNIPRNTDLKSNLNGVNDTLGCCSL